MRSFSHGKLGQSVWVALASASCRRGRTGRCHGFFSATGAASARQVSSLSSSHSTLPTATPPPSAREIHQVIQRALEQGRREHAVDLLVGALQLRCVPLSDTYELLLSSTIRHGGWRAVVDLIDELGVSAVSVRSLFHTVADMYLLHLQAMQGKDETIEAASLLHDMFSILVEAASRQVMLAPRHRMPVWERIASSKEDARKALAYYKTHMVPAGIVPPPAELLLLLQAAAQDGNWAGATLLYRQWPPSAPVAEAQVLYIHAFINALEAQAHHTNAAESAADVEKPPRIPWQEAVHVLFLSPDHLTARRDAVDARVASALKALEEAAEHAHQPAPKASASAHGSVSAQAVVAAWLSDDAIAQSPPHLTDVRTQIGTVEVAKAVLYVLGHQRVVHQRVVLLMALVLAAFPSVGVAAEESAAAMVGFHQATHLDWLLLPWARDTSQDESEAPLWERILRELRRLTHDATDSQAGEAAVHTCVIALYMTHHAFFTALTPALAEKAAASHVACLESSAAAVTHATSPFACVALVRAAASTTVCVEQVEMHIRPLVEHVGRVCDGARACVLEALLEAAADRGVGTSLLARTDVTPQQRKAVSHEMRQLAVSFILSCPVSTANVVAPRLKAALLESQDVEAALAYALPPRQETTSVMHDVVIPLLAAAHQWERLESVLETFIAATAAVPEQTCAEGREVALWWLHCARQHAAEDVLRRCVYDASADTSQAALLHAWHCYYTAASHLLSLPMRGAASAWALGKREAPPLALLVRVGVRLACEKHVSDLKHVLDIAGSYGASLAPTEAVVVGTHASVTDIVLLEGLRLYVSLGVQSGSGQGSALSPSRCQAAVTSSLAVCRRCCPRLAESDALLALSALAALACAHAGGTADDAAVAVLASGVQQAVLWDRRYRYSEESDAARHLASPTLSSPSVGALADLNTVLVALVPALVAAAKQGTKTGFDQVVAVITFYSPLTLVYPASIAAWTHMLEEIQMATRDGRVRAAVSRLAWSCFDAVRAVPLGDEEVVPWRALLVLIEVCTRHAALTHTQWQLVCKALAHLAALQPPRSDAASDDFDARLDALIDTAMASLSALGAWQEALECLAFRRVPLTTHSSDSDSTARFTASAALTCTLQLAKAAQQAAHASAVLRGTMLTCMGMVEPVPRPYSVQHTGNADGSKAALRETASCTPRALLEQCFSLGAWQEALELVRVVLALRQRADSTFIQSEVCAMDARARTQTSLWTLEDAEACVDAQLLGRVMSLVCAQAPWRTSWQAWASVQSALPFLDWAVLVPECAAAVEVLFASMLSQGAAPHEILDGVLMVTSEWGLPARSSWLRIVARALRELKTRGGGVPAAESVLCLERLGLLRQTCNEQHVVALVDALMVEFFDFEEAETAPWLRSHSVSHDTGCSPDHGVLRSVPEVSERTLAALTLLAPLIMLATPHQLYTLTRAHFESAGVHPMQLRPLLLREQRRVRARLESLTADTQTDVRAWLLDQLARQHLFVVKLAALLEEASHHTATATSCTALAHDVQRRLFSGFIDTHTAQALVSHTIAQARTLQQCRWSPLVEEELRLAVLTGQTGRPPASLRTAPQLSRHVIAHYWSLYNALLAPELHLEGLELCCLAAYAPSVETLRVDTSLSLHVKRAALKELAAAVQAVHMTTRAGSYASVGLPQTTPWHRPASALITLYTHSWKLLKRLYAELHSPLSAEVKAPLLPGLPTPVSPADAATAVGAVDDATLNTPQSLLAALLGSPGSAYASIAARAARRLDEQLPTATATETAIWRCAGVVQDVDVFLSGLLAVILSHVHANVPVPSAASLALVEAVKQPVARRGVIVDAHAVVTPPAHSLLSHLTRAHREQLRDMTIRVELEAAALKRHTLWSVWSALDDVNAWHLMEVAHVHALQRALMPASAALSRLEALSTPRRERTPRAPSTCVEQEPIAENAAKSKE